MYATPAPPAKTGSPTAPSTRYRSSARVPRRLPSSAPVKSTPKVCSVIGTGHSGIWTRAVSATKTLKATTSAAPKSHERERGNSTSTRVRGWATSDDISSPSSIFDVTVEKSSRVALWTSHSPPAPRGLAVITGSLTDQGVTTPEAKNPKYVGARYEEPFSQRRLFTFQASSSSSPGSSVSLRWTGVTLISPASTAAKSVPSSSCLPGGLL